MVISHKHNMPVVIQVYLGSGDKGYALRESIERLKGDKSLSEFIVELLKKADPALFRRKPNENKKG
jgi:hypothetical protein